MPLDVQPLSKTRRAVMLAVLIGLFGASLGLAEALVMRHPAAARAEWNFPPEFNQSAEEPSGDGVELDRTGFVNTRRRRAVALRFEVPAPVNRELRVSSARHAFEELMDAQPTIERNSSLAGRAAIEVQGISADGEFAVLRLIVVGDHAFAICYSGAGVITDADKSYFNQMCQRVVIVETPSPTGK